MHSDRFERDIKYGKESIKKAIPIIKKLYPEIQRIKSTENGNADKELSTDLKVELEDRDEQWTAKFRRKKAEEYDDVTIEILNGTGERGDFYRFNGGSVKKYIYGQRNNGSIKEILFLDAKKLAEITKIYSQGPNTKEFPGIGKLNCFKNRKPVGKASFTVIPISALEKENVIEKRWKDE